MTLTSEIYPESPHSELLHKISKLTIGIDWIQIIELQCLCLQSGLNGVGIPDLIVVQNAMQNETRIYSLDKHLLSMNDFLDFEIY
jgi:hypothetical protein